MNKNIIIVLFVSLLGTNRCMQGMTEKITLPSEQEIRNVIHQAGASDFAEKSDLPLRLANRTIHAKLVILRLVIGIRDYIGNVLENEGPAMAKIRTAHLYAKRGDIASMLFLKSGGPALSRRIACLRKYSGNLNIVIY